MTSDEIRKAILASPQLAALAREPNCTEELAAALSIGRVRRDPALKISSLGIAEKMPAIGPLPGPLAAELVLQKLEVFAQAATQSPDQASQLLGATIKRQMTHLAGPSGMAIGSPAVEQMLSVVVAAGGLTQPEMAALLSVVESPDPVSEFEVRRAIYADDGSLRV
jgi:hypothetical protein